MKKVLITLVVIILAITGIYFYFFHLSPIKKNNPLNAVPKDAAMIFSFDAPFDQWNAFTSNAIWNYLKTNEYLAEVGQSIDSLNIEVKENQMLWEVIADRPMVISIHEIRPLEFDYLYTIDLQKATQLDFVKDYLDQFTDGATKVLTRDYHNQEIIEIQFNDSPDRYYLCVNDNLLSFSTTHTLVEHAIDEKKEPKIVRDLDFIDVSKYMDQGYITVYLQHQYFKKYISQWLTPEEAEVLDFLKGSKYSGLNLHMDDQFLSMTGVTQVKDSVAGLMRAVQQSGKGSIHVASIAPANTSFFMSLGFDSPSKLYENLERNFVEEDDGYEYQENKQKLEKFLDISIEKHFLSWIDDEISLIQLHSSHKADAGDYAIAIKHNDLDDARENLDFIKAQIRKKTPVKFKGISYKGHEINFLSIKGFFKLILGKAFSKIDKPYYTIMDDYVVFSNTPKTLGKIIDAYVERTTLNQNDAFEHYMDQFEEESSLFIYINPEQLIKDSKEYLSAEYWKAVNDNRDYFKGFPMIGMQFQPEDRLLSHEFIFEYMNKNEIADWQGLINETPVEPAILTNEQETEEEESIAVEEILPDDLNAKELSDKYPNGQVKYEVSLKDGMKHGTYREYDSLGNVIIKGRYKNDEKRGTWKYYNAEGDVVKKERY